tara:strand:+ start:155 stop:397 length:243 start_codon:yes stop_codon:yes gene_type:complete
MKIKQTTLRRIIKEELQKELQEKVFVYSGDANELIDKAESLGWEFVEDDYVTPRNEVDWDAALSAATEWMESQGWRVEYS